MMKFFSIIVKEVKMHLRNISTLLIYTLMPILMILILGVTFGTQMDGSALELAPMTIAN